MLQLKTLSREADVNWLAVKLGRGCWRYQTQMWEIPVWGGGHCGWEWLSGPCVHSSMDPSKSGRSAQTRRRCSWNSSARSLASFARFLPRTPAHTRSRSTPSLRTPLRSETDTQPDICRPDRPFPSLPVIFSLDLFAIGFSPQHAQTLPSVLCVTSPR